MYSDQQKSDTGQTVSASKLKRPLQGIIIIALLSLVFVAVSSTFAQNFSQDLDGGDTLEVTCEADQLQIDLQSRTTVNITCVDNDDTPEPEPTDEPEPPDPEPTDEPEPPDPEPTSEPEPPDPEPTSEPEPPNPEPPTNASSPFGVYPNCIAPAIGLETHSWWHENTETSPRHVHIATCLPNARGTDGGGVTVNGTLPAVLRVISFNNPGEIEWVRYQWQGDTQRREDIGQRCQNSPDEFKECTWYFDFDIDTSKMNVSGMDELRISPNVDHSDLGTRQFPTLNFQIHRGGSQNYRNSEEPIARSWYTGISYARVQWSNYMDLFTSTDQAIPVVSGTIDIDVRHTKSGGDCLTSEGFVDPKFHAFHAGNASEPQPFYKENGCFDGNQTLDTTKLSNGVHTIYLQTRVDRGDGFNASAMAYMINVQN